MPNFPTGSTTGAPVDLQSLAGASAAGGGVDYLVDPLLSPDPAQRVFASLGAACDAAAADGRVADIVVRGSVATGPRPNELNSAYVVPEGSTLRGFNPGLTGDGVSFADGATFEGFTRIADLTLLGTATVGPAGLRIREGNNRWSSVLFGTSTAGGVPFVVAESAGAAQISIFAEEFFAASGALGAEVFDFTGRNVALAINERSNIGDDTFRNGVGDAVAVDFTLGATVSAVQANIAGTFGVLASPNDPPAGIDQANFAGGSGNIVAAVDRIAAQVAVLNAGPIP